MHSKQLGKSSLTVSEVGLGCWQFGGDFGPMSEEIAMQIMQASADSGVGFFDTADVYGAGISEQLIGKFRQQNPNIVVATKFGRGGDVFPDKYNKVALRDAVQASAERLQTSCLDLLQLHCIPHRVLREKHIFDWLAELKEEGLIKEFGASVETVEEGLTCLSVDGLASLQVIYNIFRQKLTAELLPQAHQAGVGIIVRLPLASGLLSGKFSSDTIFDESDHRNYNADGQHFNVGETFAGLAFADGIALAQKVKSLLPNKEPMAKSSLRWLLDQEAVTTIIPGASSVQQAQQNASAADMPPLPVSTHSALQELYQQEIADKIRGPY